MRIQLSIDTSALIKASATVLRQVEFATAQALNDVVKAAQAERRAALPKTFTIRSPKSQSFLERFIKIPRGGFARKGKLYADILVGGPDTVTAAQSRSKILTRHEAGGTFAPGINPFFIRGQDLPTTTPIDRKLYPAALGINLRRSVSGGFTGGKRKGKRRTFVLPLKSGNELIVRRVGHEGELDVLWLLTKRPIHIPPRLGFVAGVRATALREFGPAFRRRFAAAIRGEIQ